MIDVDSVIEDIIDTEGGDKLTNIPGDHGGWTRFGVTLPALSDYLGRPASLDDLKAMTHKDAHELYRQLYVQKPGFGIIGSQQLLALVVDMAVNHGIKAAVRLLQRAVGVRDDGIFGPLTKQAVLQADYGGLYRSLIAERIRFRGEIVTNDYHRLINDLQALPLTQLQNRVRLLQAKFASGWSNRDATFVEKG